MASLFLFEGLGATHASNRSASAGVDLGLGVLLLALAVRLQLKRAKPHDAHTSKSSESSKIDRYLHSRRLAAVLGVTLYLGVSPIYIAAVKSVADAHVATSLEPLDLLAIVAVMLWLIELPLLLLVIIPGAPRSGRFQKGVPLARRFQRCGRRDSNPQGLSPTGS